MPIKPDDRADAHRILTVGEVAKRAGVAVSTLHFYESRGLIRSMRSAGNQRRFPAAVLRRIAIIKVAAGGTLELELTAKHESDDWNSN